MEVNEVLQDLEREGLAQRQDRFHRMTGERIAGWRLGGWLRS
jgi:hypothetical protein